MPLLIRERMMIGDLLVFMGEPVTHLRHESWSLLCDLNNHLSSMDVHFVGGHSIWERLDRSLANNELLLKFGGTRFHHLYSDNFDHCPFELCWLIWNLHIIKSLSNLRKCGFLIRDVQI